MEALIKTIENSYGCRVESIEKVKNAYRIGTCYGYKCFKASKYDIKQFSFIMSVLTHLLRMGYENIVDIYPTIDGKDFINYENSFGFLCDWVDSREANFDNPIDLRKCIESLAKLHLCSRGFENKVNSSVRNQYGKWLSKFKKRCDELLYFKALISEKSSLTEFDKIYLKYFEGHYRQGIRAIRNLENSSYNNIIEKHKILSEFCHHDTANHNFLITPELKVYLIDFDYCIFDTHLHDLGSILIRNLRHGNWSFEKMEYILDIYNNYIPIDQEEMYTIFCFMQFPQDFWQIGLQYYIENQSWEEEIFLKKLNRIVGDSKNRFEFLRNLEGGEMFDIGK